MSRYIMLSSALLGLLLVACSGGASSGVDFLAGDGLTIKKASGETVPATSDSVIAQGDTLITDAETRVWVNLKEDISIYLGYNSEAMIELLDEPTSDIVEAQAGSARRAAATQVRLNAGDIWSSIRRPGNNYVVTTTATQAGARGTAFSSVVFEDGEELFCTCRGEITVESNGQTMELMKGQGTTIAEGVMAEKDDDLARLQEGTDPRYESCYACHQQGTGAPTDMLAGVRW